jgi:hypothetical protein
MRFAIEAGFLIVLAVIAGLAELSPTTIVLVMGAAWLLVAVIEWLAWRESPRVVTQVHQQPAPAPAPISVAPPDEHPRRRRRFWRRREAAEPEPEPAGEDTQDLPPSEQPAPVSIDERTGT